MSSVNVVHHKSPFKDIHEYLRIFFIHGVHPRHLELELCSWSRIESCISTNVAEIKDLMDGIGVPFNKYVSIPFSNNRGCTEGISTAVRAVPEFMETVCVPFTNESTSPPAE